MRNANHTNFGINNSSNYRPLFKLAVNNVEFKSFNNIMTPALTVLKHPAILIAVMFCGLNFWLCALYCHNMI